MRARCCGLRPKSVSATSRRGNGESARGAGRARVFPARGRPSRPASPRRWRPCWLPRCFCSARKGFEENSSGPVSAHRRICTGFAAVVLPLVVDARRRVVPIGREAHAPEEPVRSTETNARRPAVGGARSGTLSGSGCRRATSRAVPINAFAVISPRSAVRSRRGSIPGAIPGTEPSIARCAHGQREERAERSARGVLQIVPPASANTS